MVRVVTSIRFAISVFDMYSSSDSFIAVLDHQALDLVDPTSRTEKL
jgi:hypothetical protein